jgi:S-adenosylmethionine:tRNA ribosyltransferase-isomerase
MKRQDFSFELPQALIAQYPLDHRSDSRLLTYDCVTGIHQHAHFTQITDFINPGDLLVLNNTKVIPARVYGQKASGGKVELLVERMIEKGLFLAHIKASKPPKAGTLIHLTESWCLTVIEKRDDLYVCQVDGDVHDMLDEIGHIPLPPYIQRADESMDLNRYQTVYAEHKGSVAAPTAGLHFDERVLASLTSKGIGIAYTTLHVGAGTFRPVRCDDIKDHTMHAETFIIDEALCEAVHKTQDAGHRVIAVGTTALRSLESAAINGRLKPCHRDTDIFIYPGYEFKICDGLITNFHLSESTLLMLVSAFIGYEKTMELYQIAIAERYRFFSYGDACLFLRT